MFELDSFTLPGVGGVVEMVPSDEGPVYLVDTVANVGVILGPPDTGVAVVLEPPATGVVLEPPATGVVVEPPATGVVLEPPATGVVLEPPATGVVLEPPATGVEGDILGVAVPHVRLNYFCYSI